eukprot:TRINITY_DN31025_c0_g1_i1.p1 TRINITY_DN31025_c0_g1~~TRINITY_DN31025_c0_g1_i1.p1  ORF type:complete len:442 (-),score=43.30 TRINITY_DN31025_c0_g1_i1:457-1737(-)
MAATQTLESPEMTTKTVSPLPIHENRKSLPMLPEPAPEPTFRPSSPLLGPLMELKRRRLAKNSTFCTYMTPSPGSPALTTQPSDNDTEIVDWWSVNLVDTSSPLLVAINELRQFIVEWLAASRDDFWHRKSQKPVLSVVIARKSDGDSTFVVHRGMNTEVSLPAGSLCAERAAIARMATDFGRASSVVAIATADPLDKINPLWPCEVCQSWLAKLKTQSPEIAVVAVSNIGCEKFAVKINGAIQCPPFQLTPASSLTFEHQAWAENVLLAEGVAMWPWESENVVYVDGAWAFLHAGQQNILKEAKSRGDHLLVGVHSDDLLRRLFDVPIFEDFETRTSRVLQNRHVNSVLKGAPWALSEEMITTLRIRRVIVGSLSKIEDVGVHAANTDPYAVPRQLGMLERVQSLGDTTERSFHDAQVARMLLEE